MTSPDLARTRLSVRADAQRTVEPDAVLIQGNASIVADTKTAATSQVTAAFAGVVRDLESAGGQVLTVDTARAPFTWSAQGVRSHPDHEESDDRRTARRRHRAMIPIELRIRRFELLRELDQLGARHEALDLVSVHWLVDDDNPEWALVRADAITAALMKGQDYASALGGSLLSVEHVADAGLLGSDGGERTVHQARALSGGRGHNEASLTPVPQVLRAVIDARMTATRGPLPSRPAPPRDS